MKALNEEKIKQLLKEQLEQDEQPALTGINDDADLYRLLFTALADEPGTLKNVDLAESVVKQLNVIELKKEAIRYNLLVLFVIIAGILSAYFAISYISPATLTSILKYIGAYKQILVFIILCFGLIQIADKNFVKRNSLSS